MFSGIYHKLNGFIDFFENTLLCKKKRRNNTEKENDYENKMFRMKKQGFTKLKNKKLDQTLNSLNDFSDSFNRTIAFPVTFSNLFETKSNINELFPNNDITIDSFDNKALTFCKQPNNNYSKFICSAKKGLNDFFKEIPMQDGNDDKNDDDIVITMEDDKQVNGNPKSNEEELFDFVNKIENKNFPIINEDDVNELKK